jgi:hypothetical protein
MRMPKRVDLMIDMETLGTHPGSAILSIAAVPFDSTATAAMASISTFYEKISPRDPVLSKDPETVKWWDAQDTTAKVEAFSGIKSLHQVLVEFSWYFQSLGPAENIYIWGKGADFDPVLLAAAYDKCDLLVPWKFRNVRCFRTLEALFLRVTHVFEGVRHNALADAVNQARHAEKIFEYKTKLELDW